MIGVGFLNLFSIAKKSTRIFLVSACLYESHSRINSVVAAFRKPTVILLNVLLAGDDAGKVK